MRGEKRRETTREVADRAREEETDQEVGLAIEDDEEEDIRDLDRVRAPGPARERKKRRKRKSEDPAPPPVHDLDRARVDDEDDGESVSDRTFPTDHHRIWWGASSPVPPDLIRGFPWARQSRIQLRRLILR